MKTYYIHNGQQQIGPFTIEELKAKNIQPTTSVWSTGSPTWIKAQEVEELKEYFSLNTPPPLYSLTPSSVAGSSQIRSKKRYTWKILLLLVVILTGLFVYKQGYPSGVTFEAATRDLDAGGKYNIGLFGAKATINGFVRNSSTRTNYSDVTLEITFFDKDQNRITTEYKTINDYFAAGSSKDFQLKVDLVRGTKSIGWEVSNATAY